MMKRNLLTGVAITLMALSACNDEALDIGSSLTGQTDKLSISFTDFNVTTKTVIADSVLLRSSYCYLGKVKDPETKTYVTSEFMTQFHVLESFSLPEESKICSRYNGMAAADSVIIQLYMEEPTSLTDTLAAMKIRVSELAKPMEEDRRYYSNFDPSSEGFLRKGGLFSDKVFSYNDHTVSDSERAEQTMSSINIWINKPYTDKNGTTYNNYGTYLMQQYYQHPEYFKNSYAFNHNVCPGFFFSVVDGEGVYTEIPEMCIRFYYKVNEGKDSIVTRGTSLAGTEEVLQTTKITNDKNMLRRLADDNTCTYLKAPAGLYTEVTLPIDDIFKGHENDSIMTTAISFKRINSLSDEKSVNVPNYLMMLPKDSLVSFFETQKMPDDKLSFYTTFDKKSNYYNFVNLTSLVNRLASIKREGLKHDNNWVANHPNWNKVLLVPVHAIMSVSSTTNTVSGFEHCVGIEGTRLVGGSANPNDPIVMSVVYGKFNK